MGPLLRVVKYRDSLETTGYRQASVSPSIVLSTLITHHETCQVCRLEQSGIRTKFPSVFTIVTVI